MLTRDDLLALDAADPLAGFRARFALPDGVVYLDGNSLGAQPAAAVAAAEGVMAEWRGRLIRGWFGEEAWWDLPVAVGDRIAPVVGAPPGTVVACDTVTTNLFKVLHAALALRPEGDVLLRDSAFPTDRYVVESVAASAGRRVRLVPVGEDPAGHLAGAAVAVLEHVDFRTAEILDMGTATAAVHDAGGLAIWDLSHSAGVLPVRLDADGADFAVGCTYKYLNAGPGAPAYLYAAPRHLAASSTPIPGWLGHADPFAMVGRYDPDPGVRRFLTGTQPILSMRMVDAALDVLEAADLDAVRAKSVKMTDLFVALVDERCEGPGLEVVSPRDASRRGSQVTLRHPEAAAIQRRLDGAGVVVDFRTPDLLRFGFAPLYVSYADVWDAVETLRTVVGA